MPIYEYECAKCHSRFEYMQSFKDAPKKKCETCGGKLDKLISASGFVLKGGGWYKDLYASSSAPSSSSNSSKSESKSESAETSTKADKVDKADKADKPKADKKTKASDKK